MAGILVGYARCSTNEQDLSAQIEQLLVLGVEQELVYLDQGITGTHRERPGLDQALAAVREGDTMGNYLFDRLTLPSCGTRRGHLGRAQVGSACPLGSRYPLDWRHLGLTRGAPLDRGPGL